MMDGILRLKKLLEGQEDTALKQVVSYLCTREDLNEKFLNPEKDLNGMVLYIQKKANEHAHNGWNFVSDKVVYAWAVTYFIFSNEQLKINNSSSNKESKNKLSQKNEEISKNNIINLENIKNKKESQGTEQLTLF